MIDIEGKCRQGSLISITWQEPGGGVEVLNPPGWLLRSPARRPGRERAIASPVIRVRKMKQYLNPL